MAAPLRKDGALDYEALNAQTAEDARMRKLQRQLQSGEGADAAAPSNPALAARLGKQQGVAGKQQVGGAKRKRAAGGRFGVDCDASSDGSAEAPAGGEGAGAGAGAAKRPRTTADAPPRPARDPAAEQERSGRTVFVQGIPKSVTEDELRAAFEKALPGRVAAVSLWRRGRGFVELKGAEDVERAVAECNGTELGGAELQVEPKRGKAAAAGAAAASAAAEAPAQWKVTGTETADGRTVYVRGLSQDTQEAALRSALAACGEITGVGIVAKRKAALVEYALPSAAAACVALKGAAVDGRTVTATMSHTAFAVWKAAKDNTAAERKERRAQAASPQKPQQPAAAEPGAVAAPSPSPPPQPAQDNAAGAPE
eukprot:TRINITY_DN32827_c0_g1_i1.p2 TRINITY_DN32827_c0_g1~~TRINITY_DN32827_c0_g1_i1.p2  ORF type:complete len:369 (+),score=92.91 TRINITY_DN32827_c0_g1_i1:71-1177(+)